MLAALEHKGHRGHKWIDGPITLKPGIFLLCPLCPLCPLRSGSLTSGTRRATLFRMKSRWILGVVCAALALPVAGITAQQQPDKPQLPKSQIPDLGRPTKVTDEVPLFNFEEYFVGKWTFEWETPEG